MEVVSDAVKSKTWTSPTLTARAAADAPATAKRELSLVFEGWDIDWWLEQETKRLVKASRPAISS